MGTPARSVAAARATRRPLPAELGIASREPGAAPAHLSVATFILSGGLQGVILGTAAYMGPEPGAGEAGWSPCRRLGLQRRALRDAHRQAPAFDGSDATDTIAAVLRAQPDWQRPAPRCAGAVQDADPPLPGQGPAAPSIDRPTLRVTCSGTQMSEPQRATEFGALKKATALKASPPAQLLRDRVVDPILDITRIEADVVVVPPAVAAAVAHARNEFGRCARRRAEKDPTPGVAGTTWLGIDHRAHVSSTTLRTVDVLTRRFPSHSAESGGVERARGVVVPYPTIVVCTPSARSSFPSAAKRVGSTSLGARARNTSPNICDTGLEWSDQHVVRRIALRRRRAVGHGWVCG
jgi:hypothetical protein